MNTQSILRQMEHWGYYLLAKPYQHSPGYTQLLIAIRKTPTKLHFDPEIIDLRLCEPDGAVRQIKLRLKPFFSGSRCICPGRIVLHDRMDKRINFFIFGGSLEAIIRPDETIYSLHSPAPILGLSEQSTCIPDLLAFETEALIAKMQAKWGAVACNQHLAQVDPFMFYLASLQTILTHHHQPLWSSENWQKFYQSLLHEKEWLLKTGQWPANPANLEALLAPPAS